MGPTVGVGLREPLTEAELDDLDRWIRSIASEVLEVERPGSFDARASWVINILDGASIGLGVLDCTPSCSFGLSVSRGPEYEGYEDATAEQWIAQLGFRPAEELWLWAGCKDPLDNRILGHMALILAERYGGILDLNGAWCPPMDLDWLPDVDPDGFWQKPVDAVPYAYTGPGRIYELHYITARNTHWYSNLADVEAFRHALQGEHFWLIK